MLILLDQENVSHHGLTGISALSEKDKIITFLGKGCRLSSKLQNVLEESKIPFEVHKGLIGTKNAADYQLISFLTYSILQGEEKEFLVLSRDCGFDTSLGYLRKTHKDITLYRTSCILEYVINNFLRSEFGATNSESNKLYKSLLSARYSNLKDFKNILKKQKVEYFYFQLIPYFESFQKTLRQVKIDSSVDGTNLTDSLNAHILKVKNNAEIITILANILEIDAFKFDSYLKSIRKAIRKSKSYECFCDRILTNPYFLEIGDVKRCDIPRKIKPFYDSLKNKLEKC